MNHKPNNDRYNNDDSINNDNGRYATMADKNFLHFLVEFTTYHWAEHRNSRYKTRHVTVVEVNSHFGVIRFLLITMKQGRHLTFPRQLKAIYYVHTYILL